MKVLKQPGPLLKLPPVRLGRMTQGELGEGKAYRIEDASGHGDVFVVQLLGRSTEIANAFPGKPRQVIRYDQRVLVDRYTACSDKNDYVRVGSDRWETLGFSPDNRSNDYLTVVRIQMLNGGKRLVVTA